MIVSFEPGSKGTFTHSPRRGLDEIRAAAALLLAGSADEPCNATPVEGDAAMCAEWSSADICR
jgi:hypothetical protein